jgi:hypothetical protein
MSDDFLSVEFVGGPMDGHHRILPERTSTLVVSTVDHGEAFRVVVKDHLYKIRKVDGILVRLPNGFHAMDYQPGAK